MSNGNGQCDGGVAVLVDFENLVLCAAARAAHAKHAAFDRRVRERLR